MSWQTSIRRRIWLSNNKELPIFLRSDRANNKSVSTRCLRGVGRSSSADGNPCARGLLACSSNGSGGPARRRGIVGRVGDRRAAAPRPAVRSTASPCWRPAGGSIGSHREGRRGISETLWSNASRGGSAEGSAPWCTGAADAERFSYSVKESAAQQFTMRKQQSDRCSRTANNTRL